METRRLYKAEGLSLDRISTLPQPIIETILCLLSTKEAARTSILSREWRYQWTKLPKLELSHYSPKPVLGLKSTRRNKDIRCKCCNDMQQILLLRQGPIHELTISFPDYDDCLELDQIILNLSRDHMVKKLTLFGWDFTKGYAVPKSVFSFHHLRHLDISDLDLYPPPIFNGFDSLESLGLRFVMNSTETLLYLLSNCPSLKSLTLLVCDSKDKCTINELLECLPVIEHLTTWPDISKWVVLDSVPQELPTSLIHLRYLCFKDMAFIDRCGLAFLLAFIRCSPNLEKIKLEIDRGSVCYGKYSFVWEEYSDVWLEHLIELEIDCFFNSKPEIDFVKFILARSPKLKKVSIHCIRRVFCLIGSEMEMLKTLLQAPRVSPVVITVK